jgi:hypothetical protein
MSSEEKKEYFADQQKKDKSPLVAVKSERDWGAPIRYRMGRQGGYSIGKYGGACNGLFHN